MGDFSFIKNPVSKKWVIQAPRRTKRPDVADGTIPHCPFCNNHEKAIYSVKPQVQDPKSENDWSVKVIPNKYPFAPIHELVIHSPDHHKNFELLPLAQSIRILATYRQRTNEHSHKGQVFIFHNRGKKAGESIPHPHTQIAVIPDKVFLDIPALHGVTDDMAYGLRTDHFTIFCPKTSPWPDEVWVAPQKEGMSFGEITDNEIEDLSHILFGLITIFEPRYKHNFQFNFYIAPGTHWYLRLIPRKKIFGGFEVGTGIFVNTQDPLATMDFIKTHFHSPDIEKIMKEHTADYHGEV